MGLSGCIRQKRLGDAAADEKLRVSTGPWPLLVHGPYFRTLTDGSVASDTPQQQLFSSSHQSWCGLLSPCPPFPSLCQAPSDGVRVHLHALLATRDVPVVMEQHACRSDCVNLTTDRGKHNPDTEAQERVQPCLRHRQTDIGSSQEHEDKGCMVLCGSFGLKCLFGNIIEDGGWRLLSGSSFVVVLHEDLECYLM